MRQESERRGLGVVVKDGESEVVDGDERERVGGRALDLEGRVATAWGERERERRRVL